MFEHPALALEPMVWAMFGALLSRDGFPCWALANCCHDCLMQQPSRACFVLVLACAERLILYSTGSDGVVVGCVLTGMIDNLMDHCPRLLLCLDSENVSNAQAGWARLSLCSIRLQHQRSLAECMCLHGLGFVCCLPVKKTCKLS